jgi:FtsP/CotA-like multicopper oxidase with cupredoxin domain
VFELEHAGGLCRRGQQVGKLSAVKCNASSQFGRRAFLQLTGLAAAGSYLGPLASGAEPAGAAPRATHTLRIRQGEVELAPGRRITTTMYNGQLPGPPLRATVGQQVRVDVHNETDTTEQIHWQGQTLADATAAIVPAHSWRRMEFTPEHAGLYLYHSQVVAATDLGAGLYSGQAGALLVEPGHHPGRYDREWLVVLKGCEPFMRRTGRGYEVGYSALSVNGRLPGHCPPLRVNTGDRVLLHVLNAGATESYRLELPGHVFEVTALDGHSVPLPARVAALHLTPGQRVSAYVVMSQPSAWQVREATDSMPDLRHFGAPGLSEAGAVLAGSAVVAGAKFGSSTLAGTTPTGATLAGATLGSATLPCNTLAMVLTRHPAARSGFNRWSVNGRSFSSADPQPMFRVRAGSRYRLQIHNTSDEIIPLHLQRHRLQMSGVRRDVVAIGPQQRVEVDFLAEGRGPALLHCTRQLHADFGLGALLDYT